MPASVSRKRRSRVAAPDRLRAVPLREPCRFGVVLRSARVFVRVGLGDLARFRSRPGLLLRSLRGLRLAVPGKVRGPPDLVLIPVPVLSAFGPLDPGVSLLMACWTTERSGAPE